MIDPLRYFQLLVLLCFFVTHSNAQLKLKAGRNFPIIYSNPQLPIVEPHLAINPADADHMVIAAIVFDSAQTSTDRTHIVVFATKDNGKTWKQSDLDMKVGFDPWVVIRDKSQVALVALAGYTISYRNGLVYYYSKDGGNSWSGKDTVNFGGGHDHATMVTDPAQQRLYILSGFTKRDSLKQMHTYAWLNYTDNWESFTNKPTLIHVGPVNSNTLTINQTPAGNLIVPFVEYAVNSQQASLPVYKYFSVNKTMSHSGPYTITSNAGLAKGFAVTAVDITGKFKGRTYFVKNTGTDPRRSNGLFLQYVDSIGGKWSDDIRIDHNDAAEKFIRTAALAVNKKGIVGVAWVDRRNDPALKKNDIYFTVSADGGKTFLQEVRVSDQSSDPSTPANGKAGERFFSGGDYMGCVAKPDGSFQLVWADNRTGILQLYTANVKVEDGRK